MIDDAGEQLGIMLTRDALAIAQERELDLVEVAPNANPRDQPMVRIQSGMERPETAFAATRYRDRWFWIDDRDLRSKSIFTFLMMLFSLFETGVAQQAPVITIPVN